VLEIDRVIHELAARQHGAVSRSQLRPLGVSSRHIARRVDGGALIPVTREVLVVAGSAPTVARRSMAAVLHVPGRTGLSHRSAGAHWNILPATPSAPEVMTERRGRAAVSPLGPVHTTTLLPDRHLTVVDGIPITVPVRVLFDLANDVHPKRLERLIDTTWRMRLVTGRLLRRTLADLAEHGRPGIQIMRALIEDRGDDYRPPDSNVEARFQELMAAIGVRTFERQVDLGGMDWAGRVDFVDPALALVVEVDSFMFHLSITDVADDQARRKKLEAAGFTIVTVSDFEVWHQPDVVKERVREARRLAKERMGT
jgi:very-short-patch-repair endonuclease